MHKWHKKINESEAPLWVTELPVSELVYFTLQNECVFSSMTWFCSSHTALIPSWDLSRWAAPQLCSIFGLSASPLGYLEALQCLASGCSWGYSGRIIHIHFPVPDFPRDLNHRPLIHKPLSKTYPHQKLILNLFSLLYFPSGTELHSFWPLTWRMSSMEASVPPAVFSCL